ncbi:MAG: alpha-L-arabinofuranosidase [bacterium]|nr:alpha-L-arabinofuranosidase [bacterium]
MGDDAVLRLDSQRRLGQTDPRVWGGFVEHMGRNVYGGFYDPESRFARADGFRQDVLDAVREIGFTGLRYPGGNFNCTYDWQDGIGPTKERRRRFAPAWKQVESNEVGTDEFLPLCAELNTEPYLCVNLGTGGSTEAAAWLEYANTDRDTHFANLRRSHGFAEPWGVTLWGLGNEVDGPWNIGTKTPQQYIDVARETAKHMRLVDDSIQLIASGSVGADPRWNFEVCSALRDSVDFLAVHLYVGHEDLAGHLGSSLLLDEVLDEAEAAISLAYHGRIGGRRMAIAVDEWNVWYKDLAFPNIEEVYDQSDAVVVASLLFSMLRRPQSVKLASLAQAVNVIAPILTHPDGLVRQTIFHAFKQLRFGLQPVVLDAALESETYSAVVNQRIGVPRAQIPRDIPLVDAVATISEDGSQLTVAALSRDLERERCLTIELAGTTPLPAPQIVELCAEDPRTTNTAEHPERIVPHECEGTNDGRLQLKPCSLQIATYSLGS